MSTRKQRAANRRNAEKNSGPRSPEGKAASRYNALKHGIYAERQIMFDETAEDLAQLDAELREQFNPNGAAERFLVDTLVHNEWRLRRLRRVEAALWDSAGDNLADAFAAGATLFDRLQRIVNSCERNYHRALKELAARGGALWAALCTSQPEEFKATSPQLVPFRQSPPDPGYAAAFSGPPVPQGPVSSPQFDGIHGLELPQTA